MPVVCRDEQVAVFPRQGAQRRGVGVNQLAQHACKSRFGRAVLADEIKNRIRASLAQRGESETNSEYEILFAVIAVLDVQKGAQTLDFSATHWLGQRQHTGGAAEAYWRSVDDLPTGRTDFDGAPFLVGKVEINSAVVCANPNIDKPLSAIEVSARLNYIERRLDGV